MQKRAVINYVAVDIKTYASQRLYLQAKRKDFYTVSGISNRFLSYRCALMVIEKQIGRDRSIDTKPHQAQNGRVKKHELDLAIINELRSNFDKKFSKEEVVVLVSGSNGTKYYSASMSDIDVVIIPTKSTKGGMRLDMDALTRSAEAIRQTSETSKEQHGIFLASFAATITERLITNHVKTFIKNLPKNEKPEQIFILPIHSLIYTSPESFVLWESNMSLCRSLVGNGKLIYGTEEGRDEILKFLKEQNSQVQKSTPLEKITKAEMRFKEAYTVHNTNLHLDKALLREEAEHHIKYVLRWSGAAYLFKERNIEVNDIKELSKHKKLLPKKTRELFDVCNGIRHGNGTSRSTDDLYGLAAEVVNECAPGIE